MKKILLEIKHSINKRIGNAIESISCRLYYHSKKNSWGHCLYAMNNMVLRCVSFVPFCGEHFMWEDMEKENE